jgi:hypothetical protein
MARPKLLLLDEPSLGLAPTLVETIFATVQEINKQGATILLVEPSGLSRRRKAGIGAPYHRGDGGGRGSGCRSRSTSTRGPNAGSRPGRCRRRGRMPKNSHDAHRPLRSYEDLSPLAPGCLIRLPLRSPALSGSREHLVVVGLLPDLRH